jgi:hypothetical protein
MLTFSLIQASVLAVPRRGFGRINWALGSAVRSFKFSAPPRAPDRRPALAVLANPTVSESALTSMVGRHYHSRINLFSGESAMPSARFLVVAGLVFWTNSALAAAPPVGYYRQPAIHNDMIVFVSEGDLWKVTARGGVATRLTNHPGEENHPAISPDGQTVAFTATYEGPQEVYTMPIGGGRPTRRTCGAGKVNSVSWTPDSRILYATDAYSTLPNVQVDR